MLIFNKSIIPKEGKSGYSLERVEKEIPTPSKCLKFHKYGHDMRCCSERRTCGRWGLRDPDHTEEDCPTEIKCPNYRKNHPAFTRP